MQDKFQNYSCVFVGGLISEESREFILKNSRRTIQFAADKLQRQYLTGIRQYDFKTIYTISFPFVGNYPRSFKSQTVESELLDGNGKVIAKQSYSTLSIVSNIEKRKIFLNYLKKISSHKNDKLIFFFYALTSEHLNWIKLLRKYYQDIKIVLIVPDLPIFMNPSLSRYYFYRMIKNKVIEEYRRIQDKIDLTITITKSVAEYLQANNAIVVEGIPNEVSINNFESLKDDVEDSAEFIVLYTGTLDKMYGVKDMLESFGKLKDTNIILQICGDGPMKNEVIEISKQAGNIRYLGILNNLEVVELQSKSDLLINPRKNDQEFTKYSFPSKIMEYLSSGTPMLGYKLSGIPDEYYDYMYLIENFNDSLVESLLAISKLEKKEIEKMGINALNFIKNNKLPEHQIAKVLASIKI
ncbi:glycosyltransferase [Streptococcus iners]|uniref:Glycosyltransferase n=1 Tax=Streptococcus iners TaxID=3028084 RepID=A0AA96VM65_9STRE|nr:glycosyltransferase [Streptococcus sp. 29887]MCK3941612.1 glycosyltransferase family 4 protein [Streptococcus suis]MCK4026023.1 glycosyltransferase family 4 protein [Streptococcus suis]WNY51748.1 glycosyltransferase [Streptococcus sp. 29887]